MWEYSWEYRMYSLTLIDCCIALGNWSVQVPLYRYMGVTDSIRRPTPIFLHPHHQQTAVIDVHKTVKQACRIGERK